METLPDLTFADVEAAVRELAADNPDHVYLRGEPMQCVGATVSCYYSPNTPGAVEACIFGQGLASIGVPDEFFRDNEGYPVTDLLFVLGVDMTSAQEEWAFTVQAWQDGAGWRDPVSWLRAVQSADENVYPR